MGLAGQSIIDKLIERQKETATKDRVAANTAHWIRNPSLSLKCIHLDPHKLTNEEAKGMEETARKLQTSCRACTGQTSLQECNGGGGHDGYTTLSWCTTQCRDLYQARPE